VTAVSDSSRLAWSMDDVDILHMPGNAEKASHRTIGLDGQETWEDLPPQTAPAAGGGAMQMPPVPGGVPGYTAGAEPPRWDGSSPQPRVLSVPEDGDDAAWPEGRARSERPHAAWPQGPQGMDGYWPGGRIDTMQAGESSPGGARGVPPSTVGKSGSESLEAERFSGPGLVPGTSAGSASPAAERGGLLGNDGREQPDLVKVGPEGYIHGYICVRPPCGEKPRFVSYGDVKREKGGLIVHQPSGWAIGRVDKNDDGTFTLTHADGDTVIAPKLSYAAPWLANLHNRKIEEASRESAKQQADADLTARLRAPEPSALDDGLDRTLKDDDLWRSGNGLRTKDLTPADLDDLHETWYDYYPAMALNDVLRTPDEEWDKRSYASEPRVIAAKARRLNLAAKFRDLISSSRPFTKPAVMYRYADGSEPFGTAGTYQPGDVIADRGFVSASAKPDLFSTHDGKAHVIVHVPAGARALRSERQFFRNEPDYDNFNEYTFAPSTKFRVVSDNGDPANRQITVEVILCRRL
jgi:hypothetical protein